MREMEKVVTAGAGDSCSGSNPRPMKAITRSTRTCGTRSGAFPRIIWRAPRNLACENFLHDGTSLFIGAFVEEDGRFPLDLGHMAGFSYGFVGLRDKARRLPGRREPALLLPVRRRPEGLPVLRSRHPDQGVPEARSVRDVYGLDQVICTYDPLTGVNAYRNIHHFGMEVVEYREDVYGEFGGNLNRKDVPSDRFLMSWDLKREFRPSSGGLGALAGTERRVIRAGTRTFAGPDGTVAFEAVQDVDPGLEGESLLIQIPRDFYRMLRETDVDDPDVRRIPFDWRMATRQAFQALFRRGYEVVGFPAGRRGPRREFLSPEKEASLTRGPCPRPGVL